MIRILPSTLLNAAAFLAGLGSLACEVVRPSAPPTEIHSHNRLSAPSKAVLFPVVYTLDVQSEGRPVAIPSLNDSLSNRMATRLAALATPRRAWKLAPPDTLQAEINLLFTSAAYARNRWILESRATRQQRVPAHHLSVTIPPALLEHYGPQPWIIVFVHDQVWISTSVLQQFQQDFREGLLDHIGRIVLHSLILSWAESPGDRITRRRPEIETLLAQNWNNRKQISGAVQWDTNQSVGVMVLDPVHGAILRLSLNYMAEPGFSLRKNASRSVFDTIILN